MIDLAVQLIFQLAVVFGLPFGAVVAGTYAHFKIKEFRGE